MLKQYNYTFESFITIHKNRDVISILIFSKIKNINYINFTFKLHLLVKIIRLKNLFRENVVKVVGTFRVSLQVTFIDQLKKQ